MLEGLNAQTSKVSVNAELGKQLGKQLDVFLNNRGHAREEVLYVHIKRDMNWGINNPLNELTGLELASILLNGYTY